MPQGRNYGPADVMQAVREKASAAGVATEAHLGETPAATAIVSYANEVAQEQRSRVRNNDRGAVRRHGRH